MCVTIILTTLFNIRIVYGKIQQGKALLSQEKTWLIASK